MKDQRGNAYAYGTITESLSPLNPGTGTQSWTLTGNYPRFLPGEFRDLNGATYYQNPALNDASYSDPDKVEYEGTQSWSLSESGVSNPTTLPSHHIKDWYGVPRSPGTLTSTHTE